MGPLLVPYAPYYFSIVFVLPLLNHFGVLEIEIIISKPLIHIYIIEKHKLSIQNSKDNFDVNLKL